MRLQVGPKAPVSLEIQADRPRKSHWTTTSWSKVNSKNRVPSTFFDVPSSTTTGLGWTPNSRRSCLSPSRILCSNPPPPGPANWPHFSQRTKRTFIPGELSLDYPSCSGPFEHPKRLRTHAPGHAVLGQPNKPDKPPQRPTGTYPPRSGTRNQVGLEGPRSRRPTSHG